MANQNVLFLTKINEGNGVRGVLKQMMEREAAIALLDGENELCIIELDESSVGAASLYKGGATVAFEIPPNPDGTDLVLADLQMFAIMIGGFIPMTWEGEQGEDGLATEMVPPGFLTYVASEAEPAVAG